MARLINLLTFTDFVLFRRRDAGIAPLPGSVGEYGWVSAAGSECLHRASYSNGR
jgi:hypothetical protein